MKPHLIILLLCILASCAKEPDEASDNCINGFLDGDETAVDCGGSCEPCPTCTDGISNQGETGIDCGGPCQICTITYPATGVGGPNVLAGGDTIWLSGTGYSMAANMPEGNTLSVEFTTISGLGWGYHVATNEGWDISNYSNGWQLYEALVTGTVDLHIFKEWGTGGGEILIQVYENGTNETRRIVLYWV